MKNLMLEKTVEEVCEEWTAAKRKDSGVVVIIGAVVKVPIEWEYRILNSSGTPQAFAYSSFDEALRAIEGGV